MTTFTEADKNYRNTVESTGSILGDSFASVCQVGHLDLTKTDLTRAVLSRLKSYYSAQEHIKSFLAKVYAAPAADFLVETVAFYLKVAIQILNIDLQVASEKTVAPRRGAMRPDISIWKGEELIAAIECKTQLGWNRDGWKNDFLERERKLHEQQRNAKLFLFVMTGSNWGGFGDDERIGQQFFVLLREHWPLDVDLSKPSIEGLMHPIESLFSEVFTHAGVNKSFNRTR